MDALEVKLSPDFFQRQDVLAVARDLLGKYLFTMENGIVTGGIIIETEGYAGPSDRASHAYGNRRTKRTEVMFHHGGIAYVYLCYGIHHLLNAVTNVEGIPHAVLIRSIVPTHGIDLMIKRRNKQHLDATLTNGPGSLCQALGITKAHNGLSLCSDHLWIEERGIMVNAEDILATPRIGVDYAGKDALLPWRFCLQKDFSS